MDDLLEKAMARREQLRGELAAIEKFIADYQRIREAETGPRKAGQQMSLFNPGSKRAAKIAEVTGMMDAAEKMILDAGRPMTRSQLLRGLDEAGFTVEGTDKSKVLRTNIWRSKRFHNLKGAGYWPKSKPLPPAYSHLERRASMLGE